MLAITQENRPPLAASRPKCNSILHLFGEWLFEAAHIGTDSWFQNSKSNNLLITLGFNLLIKSLIFRTSYRGQSSSKLYDYGQSQGQLIAVTTIFIE
jgi:hypothetical protein